MTYRLDVLPEWDGYVYPDRDADIATWGIAWKHFDSRIELPYQAERRDAWIMREACRIAGRSPVPEYDVCVAMENGIARGLLTQLPPAYREE